MLNVEGFKKVHLLPLILVLSVGIAIGWLGFILLGDFVSNSQVAYVSREELLNLEKERIAATNEEYNAINKGDEENQLTKEDRDQAENHIFFGRTKEALGLMEKISLLYQNEATRVMFVSSGLIKGKGIYSISKPVHEEIVKQLQDIRE